jgi:polar amino acid transport system substrate-binding protein
MIAGWTHNRRRNLARLLFACVILLACVAALPARTHALSEVQVTLDQETGDQPIRYTFEAITENTPVSEIELTFPKGFDVHTSEVDVVTLQGLSRINVPYTSSKNGETVVTKFGQPLKGGTDVRITVNDVMTPGAGGTYPLGVHYIANGAEKTVRDVTFSFESPPIGQLISNALDRSPFVAKWNSVAVLDQFLQPELGVVALTTVWQGWLISIALILVAFPLAILGGLALAFMKMSKIWPIRWIANIYINVIRGTPLFLQIAIVFVGLPIAGARIVAQQWFVAGFCVLALNSSAYLAEIFRAGIQSISKGQFEAASSLGMTYPQAMGYVIIPQTVKRVLPTMTSEFILLFKDTALLSAYGVFELMLWSNNLVARSGNITPFMVAALYYLVVTVPLINLVARLEAKLALSEGGQVSERTKGRAWWRWRPAQAGPVSALEASSVEHESR